MFNLFKKSSEIIEQIHNEFNNAGELLLQESKKIISELQIPNEEKVKQLKKFGFSSTNETVISEKLSSIKKDKEKIASTMEYFIVNFPQYKFITQDIAENICKKYNLVIGDVGHLMKW